VGLGFKEREGKFLGNLRQKSAGVPIFGLNREKKLFVQNDIKLCTLSPSWHCLTVKRLKQELNSSETSSDN
jgi:hypothetical protein